MVTFDSHFLVVHLVTKREGFDTSMLEITTILISQVTFKNIAQKLFMVSQSTFHVQISR